MKKKDLFMMMLSLSAIPAVAPVVVSANMQALGHNPAAATNKAPVASGNSTIFTLGVGAIPVTERSKLGDQRLRTLEEGFAARLGLNMFGAGESAVPEQYAMRPICCSKTIDCEISPGDGCVNDTDDSF
jgi:hypothetical protein